MSYNVSLYSYTKTCQSHEHERVSLKQKKHLVWSYNNSLLSVGFGGPLINNKQIMLLNINWNKLRLFLMHEKTRQFRVKCTIENLSATFLAKMCSTIKSFYCLWCGSFLKERKSRVSVLLSFSLQRNLGEMLEVCKKAMLHFPQYIVTFYMGFWEACCFNEKQNKTWVLCIKMDSVLDYKQAYVSQRELLETAEKRACK